MQPSLLKPDATQEETHTIFKFGFEPPAIFLEPSFSEPELQKFFIYHSLESPKVFWGEKRVYPQVAQARNMSIGRSALLRNIQNIRICMGKKPILSLTYENERISIKNSLPYLKCVLRLPCVVHGPIYGRFMGFYVNAFSLYKGLPSLTQRP